MRKMAHFPFIISPWCAMMVTGHLYTNYKSIRLRESQSDSAVELLWFLVEEMRASQVLDDKSQLRRLETIYSLS